MGAELSGQGRYEKGKFKLKGTAGAALGLGGKLSVDLTVDVSKAEEEGKAFADNVNHFGKQGVEIVDHEMKQADAVIHRDLTKFGNETKAVFEQQIPQSFNQLGQEIKSEATKAGTEVKTYFEQDVKNSFTQTGKEIETGANKAGNDVKNYFENDVKNSFNQAGNSIEKETNKAVQQVDQGVKKFGNDVEKGFKSLFKW